MTREQAIDFLKNRPHKFGHLLGFTKLTPLHGQWIRKMVCGREDYSLAASRNTYKTTCDSIALSLIIMLLPNKRTMFARKTDNDVKEILSQVKKILRDPHTQVFVQAIYGKDIVLKLTRESATEINTNLTQDIKGTSQLVGMGIGGSLTGKHFDYIFTDDIINLKDRISKAEREATKTVYQELQNIKNRGGKIINTLTIWHKDDASVLMPNLEKFNCYHEEIAKIITPDVLAEKKASMTAALFACNYELKIIADENLMFTERPIEAGLDVLRDGLCHIDAAYGGEDYTAFTCMAYKEGHFYIYGRCWQKHVEDCYNDIIKEYNRIMLGCKCLCETNADKGFLAKDLKRKHNMRMVTYTESMNKHLKISTYLKAIWNYVIFVVGTDDEYIEQILDYTEEADHDDCADSASCLARKLYKKAGIRIDIANSIRESEIGEGQ